MLSPSSLPISLTLSLLFLLLSLSHATNKQPNYSLPPSESETLFTIMEAMSSDQPWRQSHPNPCSPGSSWPGLECTTSAAPNDPFAHVSRLDFGSHPNPSCKPTSSFPHLIFSLPFLQSVFFFNCFTHFPTLISLPFNMPLSNSSLQQLSLRSNPSLVGHIPSRIHSLKSLQVLTLSQNRLTGNIPAQIFNLRNLVHLDLSYNRLTGIIPVQLGNLKNLEGLDLSYNSITGSIPRTISQLGMLQKLDLSSNSLFGRIPDGVEKLGSLSFMALSNNRLIGRFPKGISKLQNLQYFIMDDNPTFIPLPAELGFLARLQELRLANSGYSGKIPDSYTQLKNLSSLSLANNRLRGEIPPGFGSLPHILHLNLSRNTLNGVVPFDSSFLKRLGKNLDLSGNSGLCLKPADEFSVEKTGVDICGKNTKGRSSSIQTIKGSQAPLNHYGVCLCNSLVFQFAVFLGLHHRLLL